MRILIAYATKSGSSREMAELLASLLQNHEVTLCDLAVSSPDPAAFDYAVLGGSVRFGKLSRPARRYFSANAAALADLPHTLFLCCAFAEQFDNYVERVFPKAIWQSAEERAYFGGDLRLSRHRGLDRLMVRMMRNSAQDIEMDHETALPGLLPEHVRLLADKLRARGAKN